MRLKSQKYYFSYADIGYKYPKIIEPKLSETIEIRASTYYNSGYYAIKISETPDTSYVSVSGNDDNSGIISAPLRTINAAIASGSRKIYITEGEYSLGSGLYDREFEIRYRDNINISGGWNTNFTSLSGYSVINGKYYSDLRRN